MGLNENHRHALLSTVLYVDDLLAKAEASLAEPLSPFSAIVQDLSPERGRHLAAQVAVLRARMVEMLGELGIQLPGPRIKASWSIKTSLTLARIALGEASPSRLTGYGALDAETAAGLERIELDLDRCLLRLSAWLERGGGQDLVERVAALRDAPVDLALLRDLVEIVCAHGLVEFHGALESILASLEEAAVRIAFLGRSGSGKSSLIDLIPAVSALPAGFIRIAEAATLSELDGEAGDSDSGSKGQARRLPRFDIGVVLLDVGGALSRDDIDSLRLLLESGIQPVVLVSKADLIGEQERRALFSRVGEEIAQALAARVPVFQVSTADPDAAMALGWLEQELAPLVERTRRSSIASIGQQLEALRETALMVLRSTSRAAASTDAGPEARRADDAALEAEELVRATRARLELLVLGAGGIAAAAIEAAAYTLVQPRSGPPLRPGALVKESLLAAARDLRTEVCEELIGARDRLAAMAADLPAGEACRGSGAGAIYLDLLSLPNIAVPESLDAIGSDAPWWLRMLGGALERWFENRIRARSGEDLEGAVMAFSEGIRAFAADALGGLAEQVAACVEPLRLIGRLEAADSASVEEALHRLERCDRAEAPGERDGA